jgi:hypothetical protein
MAIVNHWPLHGKFFTLSSVASDDWHLHRIKYTTDVWRSFKYKYHSKPRALRMTSLDYPLSNASVFADITFKIVVNYCDRRPYKKSINK